MAASDPIFLPPALHELESEVMAEVWGQGCVTVRAVFAALKARNDKQSAYTTIMTIMQRLDDKGCCAAAGRARPTSTRPA